MHLCISQLQLTLQQLNWVSVFFAAQGIHATEVIMGTHERGYEVTHRARAHGLVLEWRLCIREDRPELDQEMPFVHGRKLTSTSSCQPQALKTCDFGGSCQKKSEPQPGRTQASSSVPINHVLLVVQLRLDEAGPATCRPMIDLAYFPSDQKWTVEQDYLQPSDRSCRIVTPELLKEILLKAKTDDGGPHQHLQTMARLFTSTYLN